MFRTLMVDSRDRDYAKYSSPSNYKIGLPVPYHNVSSIKLLSSEIPQTFFVFSEKLGNTSIVVSAYDADGTTLISKNIVISDGNYDLNSIATALSDSINKAFVINDITFTVAVNTSTLKLSITSDQGRVIVIDTTSNNVRSPLVTGWGLGYNLGFTKNAVISGSTVTCQGVLSLDPYMYILLDIMDIGRIDECSINEPGNGGKVFAKIPIQCKTPFGNIINHGNACLSSKSPFKPPLASISSLSIKFRFHDGNLIDFNNVDHSFTLEFECIPEGHKIQTV